MSYSILRFRGKLKDSPGEYSWFDLKSDETVFHLYQDGAEVDISNERFFLQQVIFQGVSPSGSTTNIFSLRLAEISGDKIASHITFGRGCKKASVALYPLTFLQSIGEASDNHIHLPLVMEFNLNSEKSGSGAWELRKFRIYFQDDIQFPELRSLGKRRERRKLPQGFSALDLVNETVTISSGDLADPELARLFLKKSCPRDAEGLSFWNFQLGWRGLPDPPNGHCAYEFWLSRSVATLSGPRPQDARLDLAGFPATARESRFAIDLPKANGITLHEFCTPWSAENQHPETSFAVVSGITGKQVCEAWNAHVGRLLEGAVHTVRGDRPMSLAPLWTELKEEWSVARDIKYTSLEADDADVSAWGYLFHGDAENLHLPPADDEGLDITVQFPRLRGLSGNPLRGTLKGASFQHFTPSKLRAIRRGEDVEDGWLIAVEAAKLELSEPLEIEPAGQKDHDRTLRVGAFDLRVASESNPDDAAPAAAFKVRIALENGNDAANGQGWRLEYENKIDFTLDSFAPGTQDMPEYEQTLGPAARRDKPLVIQLDGFKSEAVSGKAPIRAAWLETARKDDRQKHKIEVSTSKTLPGGALLVLDTEPFFVAKVEFPDLALSDVTNQIAYYESDGVEGAVWNILTSSAPGAAVPGADDAGEIPPGVFTIQLPPQAVGEEIVKRHGRGIAEGQLSKFRFGRPAALRVYTTYRTDARRYVEAAHNLRRIFGDATQRAPGAPLFEADFEILYGLRANMAQTGLVLSEYTAECGVLPSLLPPNRLWVSPLDPGKYNEFRDLWARTHIAFRSRLGVLALRLRDGGDPGIVQDRLRFALRRNAETSCPVELLGQNLPLGDGSAELYDAKGGRCVTDTVSIKPKNLIYGGAEAGFESRTIYKEVWDSNIDAELSRKNVGQVSGIHFSALGGWGHQKAMFANGKSAIIARVAMGRTYFYSLERVGRIQRYWHRAKHVIVYERTVLPSEQFKDMSPVPEKGIDKPASLPDAQPNNYGRTVIRKVAEYVEILQPHRVYPDFDYDAKSPGPCTAVLFATNRIPVSSAWGEDVDGVGWRVPLWNLAAATAKPHVYPKPRVEAHFATGGDIAPGSAPPLIDDPENLYFFTSTVAAHGSDTDAWPAIRGADFPDLPEPRPLPGTAILRENPDAMLPPAAPVEPGWGMHTNRVTRAGAGARLTHARSTEEGLKAVLDTFSMVRATPRVLVAPAEIALSEALGAAAALAEAPRQVLGELASRLGELAARANNDVANFKKTAEKELERRSEDLARLKNHLEKIDSLKSEIFTNNLCDTLKNEADAQLSRAKTRLDAEYLRIRARLAAELAVAGDDFNGKKQLALVALDQLAFALGTVSTPLDRAANLLQSGAPSIGKFLNERLNELAQKLTDEQLTTKIELEKALNHIQEELLNVLALQTKRLAEQFGHIGVNFETLASLVRVEANDTLNAGAKRVLEFFDGGGKSADDIRKEILTQLTQVAHVADLLPGGIGTLGRSVIAKLERFINQAEYHATRDLTRFRDALRQLEAEVLADLDHYVEETLGKAAEVFARAAHAIRTVAAGCRAEMQALFETAREADTAAEILKALDPAKFLIAIAAIDRGLAELSAKLSEKLREVIEVREKLAKSVQVARDAVFTMPLPKPDEILKRFDDLWKDAKDGVAKILGDLLTQTQTAIDGLCKEIGGFGVVSALKDEAEKLCTGLIPELSDILKDPKGGDIKERLLLLRTRLKEAEAVFGDLGGQVLAQLPNLDKTVDDAIAKSGICQAGSRALALVRAYGDGPVVQGMVFNRAKIAYYFNGLRDVVETTPMAAMVDRAGQELKAMGIRLPTLSLTDKFLPNLDNLDLSILFPDFAGIRLDGMFPGIRAPFEKDDRIKVTQGFERDARRAWLQARVRELPIGQRCELFNAGPISVSLQQGTFDATARLTAAQGQPMQKVVRGEIRGDWVLAFGGSPMVTFVDTPLALGEDGKLKFKIEARNVRLSGALSFIDKFLSKFAAAMGQDTGLKFGILKDQGLPVGIECLFDISLPPMSYGTFGISGMRFGAGMSLRAFPDFQIGARAFVGTPGKPFTITVFILGGAGYLDANATYTPALNEVRADFAVEIGLSAMLGFSFGPISGGVQIFLGIRAELHTRSRASTRFSVIVVLRITGTVNVAGIITVAILLLLEARIEGESVSARGLLELTVKLGFLKKSFRVEVTYNFSGGSEKSLPTGAAHALTAHAAVDFDQAAADYLATLY